MYLFLAKDGDNTRNLNIKKCLNLQSRYAAITPFNFNRLLIPGDQTKKLKG